MGIEAENAILAARLLARKQNKIFVFTNGCFDLFHIGHLRLLEQAREQGNILCVAVNSDLSVRRRKPGRPIVEESERMAVVAALRCVDYVCLMDDDTPERLIALIQPDVHVKGGDWRVEDLPEAAIVRKYGGRVVIIPRVEKISTTDRIAAIKLSPPLPADNCITGDA